MVYVIFNDSALQNSIYKNCISVGQQVSMILGNMSTSVDYAGPLWKRMPGLGILSEGHLEFLLFLKKVVCFELK